MQLPWAFKSGPVHGQASEHIDAIKTARDRLLAAVNIRCDELTRAVEEAAAARCSLLDRQRERMAAGMVLVQVSLQRHLLR